MKKKDWSLTNKILLIHWYLEGNLLNASNNVSANKYNKNDIKKTRRNRKKVNGKN